MQLHDKVDDIQQTPFPLTEDRGDFTGAAQYQEELT